MKPLQFVCLLLSMGEFTLIEADFGVQPVDAILLIDGAPTYLRLTNSTSLDAIYSCILEKSLSINSVIMSAQVRGLEMDIGQIEENVNEIVSLLSEQARSNGRTLWKCPEELKLFKVRLAHYLTNSFYDNRPNADIDEHGNLKTQRSATRIKNQGSKFYRTQTNWGEPNYEPRRQFPTSSASIPFIVTPGPYERRGMTPARFVLTPSAASVPDRTTVPRVAAASRNHYIVTKTENPAAPVITERCSTSNTSSIDRSYLPPFVSTPNQTNTSKAGIHQVKWTNGVHQEAASSSSQDRGKIEPEIATKVVKEPEASVFSIEEGIFRMGKSKTYRMTDDPLMEKKEDLPGVIPKKFEMTSMVATTPAAARNVTNHFNQMKDSSEVKSSEVSSIKSEKLKRVKVSRKSVRKRIDKSLQQSSTMANDQRDEIIPSGLFHG